MHDRNHENGKNLNKTRTDVTTVSVRSAGWIRWLRWSVDHCLTCFKLLLDFGCGQIFRSLSSIKTKKSLVPIQDDILMQSAIALAKKIRQRKLTSESLVRASIDRITETQPLLNAVVDQRFTDALEEAKKVDRILSSLCAVARKQLSDDVPFLGVPFSTKEGICVKGMCHSHGVLSRRNVKASDDSEVVASLRKAGAIPLCLTNVSELGLWWESSNYLYGTSNNPYSLLHTPGGSSGGEASLQSSAGIPLSVGSDVGGSIRTPASFCSLFSHKPTFGLTRNDVGPMCRFAEDLVPIVKVLIGDFVDKLNLDEEVRFSKLRFYYLEGGIGSSLTVSPVSPQVRQAMLRVVCYLEDSLGVSCKPVVFPLFKKSLQMFRWHHKIEEEKNSKENQELKNGPMQLTREWAKWLTGQGNHILPNLLSATSTRLRHFVRCVTRWIPFFGASDPMLRFESTKIDVETLRNEIQELLGEDGVLLCPAHPTRVPFHGETLFKPFNFLYTAIFNVLGTPVTTVPLGLDHEGLPIGIQIIASPMNDRVTLAVAKELERPFGGWTPPFKENLSFY